MASDVLSALLGILAGGAGGYVEAKETRRKEGLASQEAATERASRKEAQKEEIAFREREGKAGRLSDKELTVMKLQAERENLNKQLQAQLDRQASSNAVERDRINVERDRLIAEIDRVDKEIRFKEKELSATAGLKRRELDIEQGKSGLGGPLGSAAGAGTNPLLARLPDMLEKYISARGSDMKPDEAIGFLRTVINMNFVNQPENKDKGGSPISSLGNYPSSGVKPSDRPITLFGELGRGLNYLVDPVSAKLKDVNKGTNVMPQMAPVQVMPNYSSMGAPTSMLPSELNFGPQSPNPELEGLFNSIFQFPYEKDKPLITRSSYIRRERGNNLRTLK